MHPLDGPRAKVAGANEQANALNKLIQRFFKDNPRATGFDLDPDAGEGLMWVEIGNQPPLRWSVIIGEIIHDLRSALDHLAWQLGINNLRGRDPHDRTEFPIFLDATGKDGFGKKGRPKIRDLGPNSRAFIEGLQPFDRPDDPLWILQTMSNTDKHRIPHLNVVTAEVSKWKLVPKDPRFRLESIFYESPVILEGRTVFARVVAYGPPGSEMEVHPRIIVRVAFGKGTPVDGQSPNAVIDRLGLAVSDIIESSRPLFRDP